MYTRAGAGHVFFNDALNLHFLLASNLSGTIQGGQEFN